MSHVVLLGDSIFDNAAYVAGAPDVVRQVRRRLPQGWKATLAAVDGDKIGDVRRQLRRLPADATHLVISVGGNDALGSSDFLGAPARSTAEALSGLADIGEEFERCYLAMLAGVLAYRLHTAICTVYYPRFPDAALQKVAVAGLTVFNDCIVRAAVAHGLPLLDLRLICTEEQDYANPIAYFVHLEVPDEATRFSDNYFDLKPGEERTISITNPRVSLRPQAVEVRWR